MRKINRWKRFGIFLIIIVVITAAGIGINKIASRPVFSDSSKTRHLIVISVDALDARDFEEISMLPNFKSIMDNGSYAKEVVGVYPSLTYPSHTSIITGVYPDKHGIYANELNEPGVKKQSWFWYKKYIKVPTLYDMAKKSNMKVGAMFWPVTAGADIDYNCPEIWTVKEGQNQTLLSLKNGSPLFLFMIDRKFGNLREGTSQPQLDNFTAASSAYMIRSKKPNLALIHFTDLDHQKHMHGIMSNEARDALKNIDEKIGEVIQAVKDAGIYNDTTFVVLGDHAFMDVEYQICLNAEFRDQGLLSVDGSGNLTDWKAYANYCDGSVQIFLKNPDDTETYKKVEEILYTLEKDDKSGIEKVYTKEEARKKGVDGDFVFMAEARQGYYFANNWAEDLIIKIDKNKVDGKDDSYYVATHGFDPEKDNYRTFFMASGAGVKKGVILPSINLVDECPTMAALLGLEMDNVDGRVLEEIIER